MEELILFVRVEEAIDITSGTLVTRESIHSQRTWERLGP